MNPVTIANSEWLAILNALTAATRPWDGAIVKLFQNNFNPTPSSLLADFTVADFTGYANSAAVVWTPAAYLPDGTAVVTADAKTFAVGATPTVFNTVYGWYLTNAGGTALLFSRRFDTPVVLSGPLQQIIVLPAFPAYVTQ